MTVSDVENLFVPLNFVNVNVTQSLNIIKPTQNQVVVYPNTFDVLVQTDPSLISVMVEMNLTCSDGSRYFAVPSNNLTSIEPNDLDIGPCELSVVEAPEPYFTLPAPTLFYIKLKLEYAYFPSVIGPNIPFTVELQTPYPIPPSPSIPLIANINLQCDTVIVYSWLDNPIDVPLVLTLPQTVQLQSERNCFFTTGQDNPYYSEAVAPVTVIKSPFGQSFYPITDEEILEFTKSVAFTSPVADFNPLE